MPVGPLSAHRIWEIVHTPATGFVGRMFAYLGAAVELLEPPEGSALRDHPPFVGTRSALFDFLAAGVASRPLPSKPDTEELATVNVLVHDRPLSAEWRKSLEAAPVPERGRVVVSVTPYGETGPKASWVGSELTLFQGGGEGYLMPSGLAFDLFPDRPPIGVGRYLGSYEGGLTAALTALAGMRSSRRHGTTEWVDVSVQDAQLSLNYFTFSRYVEGVLERRANRAFSYGGVFACADGHVELVPLEQHQWLNLREMLGDPEWAADPKFDDPIERASHGSEINEQLARWIAGFTREEVTRLAIEHGVPCGPFTAPEELPGDEQFASRQYFVGADGTSFPGIPVAFNRWPRLEIQPAPSGPAGAQQ